MERLPVIFTTALNRTEDETRCFDVGGSDYVSKPISPPVLRARMQTHLELQCLRRQTGRSTA